MLEKKPLFFVKTIFNIKIHCVCLLICIFLVGCNNTLQYYDDIGSDGGLKRQKIIRKYTRQTYRKMKNLRKANKGVFFQIHPK